MAWPVTDFNGVQFNDGTGYAEVVAIHLAIKERADAVGHSLASGDYTDEWDTAQVIWHDDDYPVDGRLYLKAVLTKFYNDIGMLLTGGTVRFLKTLSFTDGREYPSGETGTGWTLAGLVTDIGMGAFADMLTATTNYDPFLWLHEALDRLIYVRAYGANTSATIDRNYRERPAGPWPGPFGWQDVRRSALLSETITATASNARVYWRYQWGGLAASNRAYTTERVSGMVSRCNIPGTLVTASAIILETATGNNLDGTGVGTPIPVPYVYSVCGSSTKTISEYGAAVAKEWILPGGFSLNTDNPVYIDQVVSTPYNQPFAPIPPADTVVLRGDHIISALLYQIGGPTRYYIDLTGILADQA